MNNKSIFVVDDEKSIRVTLADDLRDMGYKVYEYDNPMISLLELNKYKPDIIFSDIKMPEMTGIELLKEVKKQMPSVYFIIMTGYGTISSAVESVKLGAYNYLNKPLNFDDILIILNQINNIENLKDSLSTIIGQTIDEYDFTNVIGNSESTKQLLDSIKLVAKTDFTVLIQGETGTGKELIANVLHYNSLRYDKPFIKLSCAILSKEIFESELFGHEKGSFTGAIKEKKGRFELANGGTIYLDDIDDIPYEMQVKLLRVLEESEFERVGGETTIKINVRVIASTKKNLQDLVRQGKFREDLFYRINVYPILLKSLRERKDDVRSLFYYFLNKIININQVKVDEQIFRVLENYKFPGNVRELKHLVERLVILSGQEKQINTNLLPLEMLNADYPKVEFDTGKVSLDEYLGNLERQILEKTLKSNGGNKSKTSEILKLPYSTLRTKLEKYNLL